LHTIHEVESIVVEREKEKMLRKKPEGFVVVSEKTKVSSRHLSGHNFGV